MNASLHPTTAGSRGTPGWALQNDTHTLVYAHMCFCGTLFLSKHTHEGYTVTTKSVIMIILLSVKIAITSYTCSVSL